MRSGEIYSVKWNNYTPVLRTIFRRYLKEEKFTDITLSCGSESIQVHRIVLCACSPYFESLLSNGSFPMTNKTILFLKDIKAWQLRSLVSYMYNGEVNVQKDHLSELVAAAQSLNIKGLAPDVPEDKIDPDILRSSRNAPSTSGSGLNENLKRKISPQAQQQFASKAKILKISENGSESSSNKQNGIVVSVSQDLRRLRSSPGTSKPLPPLQEIKMSPSDKDQSNLDNESDDGQVQIDNLKYERSENDASEPELEEEDDFQETEGEVSQNGTGGSELGPSYVIGGQGGKRRFVSKYSQEVRDSVLAAIHGGMTIRQCSDTFNIPRKTLSKWKNKDNGESNATITYNNVEEQAENVEEEASSPPEVTKSRRTPSVAYDTQDRAERLELALKLTLTGTTVRQAASVYQIPRTTLCAYMKRKGVQKQVAAGGRCTYSVPNSENEYGASSSGQNNDNSEDFPFLGLSSLMDGIARGEYADGDDDEAYEDL